MEYLLVVLEKLDDFFSLTMTIGNAEVSYYTIVFSIIVFFIFLAAFGRFKEK